MRIKLSDEARRRIGPDLLEQGARLPDSTGAKLCDFCSRSATVMLDVPDFIMGDGIRSVAGWYVCSECEELVHAERKDELLERAKNANPEAAVVGIYLEELHDAFWKAYSERNAFVQAKRTVPPWEQAVDAQMSALKNLDWIFKQHTKVDLKSMSEEKMRALAHSLRTSQQEFKALTTGGVSKDVLATIMLDRHLMRAATTYSFSGDARNAILEASSSIPPDSPLQTSQIPGDGNGFWYFIPPLDIRTTTDGSGVSALLWGVGGTDRAVYPKGTPIDEVVAPPGFYLSFSVYTFARTTSGTHLMPSTLWKWRLGETVERMLEHVRAGHGQARIGEDGLARIEPTIFDVDQTVDIVRRLSTFFLAACVWMDQEIVETSEGHIERHARKRYVREHKLVKLPAVRVIHLRKKHRTESAEQPSGEPPKWSYRWVVGGHWRNQSYGAKRELRRLIYIMPFVKGPEGLPLREARKKVFAVLR